MSKDTKKEREHADRQAENRVENMCSANFQRSDSDGILLLLLQINFLSKCQIQLCIPATHDTFQFGVIVPALYDEYTVLVKSGNVVSKHVNGW